MSIVATISGLIILLIRRIKRIPRRIIMVLWLIPFLRMLIPVGIGSKYGIMSLISKFATKTVTVFEFSDFGSISMTNCVRSAESYFPITYKVNILEDVFQFISVIWIVIVIAFVIAFIILYAMTIYELKDSEHLRGNIYLSHKTESPAAYGIVRPKIIVPYYLKEKDLTFIVMHEKIHIKRLDNLWRILAFFTVIIHWYNPLSWVFLKCFLSDIELSCDEKVISKCSEENKKAYALSLIEFAENKNVLVSGFGGAKMRVRIENILSYRRISVISYMGFSLLVGLISFVLLTNAS